MLHQTHLLYNLLFLNEEGTDDPEGPRCVSDHSRHTHQPTYLACRPELYLACPSASANTDPPQRLTEQCSPFPDHIMCKVTAVHPVHILMPLGHLLLAELSRPDGWELQQTNTRSVSWRQLLPLTEICSELGAHPLKPDSCDCAFSVPCTLLSVLDDVLSACKPVDLL